MAGVHSRLSPSSAEGWANCPYYPIANEGRDSSSEAAAEGTMAHEISDICLSSDKNPSDFVGKSYEIEGFSFVWSDEDAEFLEPGIQEIRNFVAEHPGCVFVGEHRVDVSRWLGPGQSGTLDRGMFWQENGLWNVRISDLKYGRGIPVTPVGNKQLRIYALGFIRELKQGGKIPDLTGTCTIQIDQPRNLSGGGSWTVTREELVEFGKEIRAAAARTHEPDPPRIASLSACQWCYLSRNQPGCPAYDQMMLDVVSLKMSDLDDPDAEVTLPHPNTLTPERRAFIWKHQAQFSGWLARITATLMEDAVKGDHSSGLKAVAGRRVPDKWKDSKRAARVIEEMGIAEAFRPALRSPKQVRALESVDLDELDMLGAGIETGGHHLALTSVEDDRPAYTQAESLFEDQDDEENI